MKQQFAKTLFSGLLLLGHQAVHADSVDFNRDIKPILSNHCYQCHGFDEAARVHELRLDTADGAYALLESDAHAIVPGDLEASELIARINSSDPDDRMPPAETNRQLSKQEVELLSKWIEEGAKYQPHWAYVPPQRPDLPDVKNSKWTKDELDRFVLARLEQAGLHPNHQAKRVQLIRRLHFDLTGLPATPEETDAILQDDRSDWYELAVDRLLDSPHFGERMAQNWLDAARYADTTGYAADAPRTQWLYRDWVINAFNTNMPFNQFTIEQLAGDMLPNATTEQKIATGFHRQSTQALGNNPRKEEFRIKGIVDRLMTTGRVWMGMTLECAECHDHKYDPISQKEYYQLFAIFNNVPHLGETFGVHGPRITVLPAQFQKRRAEIQRQIAALESSLKADNAELAERQRRWESRKDRVARPDVEPMGRWLFGRQLNDSTSKLKAKLVSIDGKQAKTAWSSASPHKDASPLEFNLGQHLQIPNSDKSLADIDALTITAWIKTKTNVGNLISNYDWRAKQRSLVFGIGGEAEQSAPAGKLFAWISSKKDPFQGVEVYSSQPVNNDRWHHVALVFEAGKSVRLYIDGNLDHNAQEKGSVPKSIAQSKRNLAIAAGYKNSQQANAFSFDGKLADVRLYSHAIEPFDTMNRIPQVVSSALEVSPSNRTPIQRSLVRDYYSRVDPQLRKLRKQISHLKVKDRLLDAHAVQAQVMQEMDKPRETYVLVRGNFESRGDRVEPALPNVLLSKTSARVKDERVDRLSFARWLVSDSHPLTARVTVNRIWQHFFGKGLVRTDADFGYQGEWPTHPQLLDFLATEFVASSWDTKAMVKRIVMSATYQQDSSVSGQLLEIDPDNRLLARASRFRLPAEQIRDVMLASSGLMDHRVGGPSTFPIQPEGLFQERTTDTMGPFKIGWDTSSRKDRYRRGMYVFWKRTILYPSLKTFDAPTRAVCTTQRSNTNTPMQALVALNDPVFIEGAVALAQRVLCDKHSRTFRNRLSRAFRLVLGRLPEKAEQDRFHAFYEQQLKHFEQHTKSVADFVRMANELNQAWNPRSSSSKKLLKSVSPAEFAAWSMIASTLLNLDEAITRE